MKNLMDHEFGWATLDSNFIFKVVQIIAAPQSLINVCRPATAILNVLSKQTPRAHRVHFSQVPVVRHQRHPPAPSIAMGLT